MPNFFYFHSLSMPNCMSNCMPNSIFAENAGVMNDNSFRSSFLPFQIENYYFSSQINFYIVTIWYICDINI